MILFFDFSKIVWPTAVGMLRYLERDTEDETEKDKATNKDKNDT